MECKPNELIRFQVITGPDRLTGTYQFEALRNATCVTFTLHYEVKGFARFIMETMINRTMQGEVATLSNLKAYLESK